MGDIEIDIDYLFKQVTGNDNKEAFRYLFDYMYPPLMLYSKRYINTLHEREDIVQDVFCSIWVNRKKINCDCSAKNYLITCLKNKCINYLSKQRTIENFNAYEKVRMPVYEHGGEDAFFLHELEELLEVILSKLPGKQRLAFELTHLENRKKQEVADQLGLSIRTIERYNVQTVDHLKRHLKGYLFQMLLVL